MRLVILLLGALALCLIWLMLRRAFPPRPSAPPEAEAQPPVQTMVSCAHCALSLPQREAIKDAAGHWYCGPAHREAGPLG